MALWQTQRADEHEFIRTQSSKAGDIESDICYSWNS